MSGELSKEAIAKSRAYAVKFDDPVTVALCDMAEKWRAHCEVPPSATAAMGEFVLVPREPTEAMSQAYYNGITKAGSLNFYPVWLNMLEAAAPAPSLPNQALGRIAPEPVTAFIPIAGILAEIDHIEQNGIDVAKFGGQEADEGRCRQLCAMYLREFIIIHGWEERMHELDGFRMKSQPVEERASWISVHPDTGMPK